MNNEIKEIIEYFKDDIDYLEEALKYPNFKGRYITIRDKECEYLRKLLDYITNLQEENKEAHDFDETMKDIKDNLIARINRQECEIHNLQQRIDKAIEYIENNFISYEDSRTFGQLGEEIEIQVKEIRYLFKILKGSDKE